MTLFWESAFFFFLDIILRTQSTKTKKFLPSLGNNQKVRRQPMEWKIILRNHVSDNEFNLQNM
jgi:hypothetical protein